MYAVLGFFSRFFIFSSVLFYSLLAYSQSLQWDPKVVAGELSNGFRYVFYSTEDPQQPFNLRLIVNAGSVDDEMRGMAHVVEHMVFRANRAHPQGVHRLLDQLGWKTGVQVNALTRQTETQYMIRTRPNDSLDLTQSIHLLNDLAFGAKLLDSDWAVEREVILEEMRRGAGVAERVNNAKKKVVRNGSRYVDRPTIGTAQSVGAISAAQIRDFYQRYYVPANMTLVASGYIERDTFIEALEQSFAKQPYTPAPPRDYVKLPLKPGLVIDKVQDPKGSTAAVTIGFRSEMLPKSEPAGKYQQLQNYFLRKLLQPLVRASKELYSEEIKSVHLTISQPTNQRIIMALSAKTTDYAQGLEIVLREVERLKQNGVSESALAQLKAKAIKVVENNRRVIPLRSFAEWEDKLTAAVMQQGVEEDYAVNSARTLAWIEDITVESLNQRLTTLLSAEDQFLFYQLPGGVEQALPTVEHVTQLKAQLAQQNLGRLTPASAKTISPEAEPEAVQLQLDEPSLKPAHVLSKHLHLGDDVTEWQLANGDKLVWLNRATDEHVLYLKALSKAGYYNHQQAPWLAQTAYQLWQQADYAEFDNQQFNQWQRQQQTHWQWAQKETQLDLSARVAPQKLRSLMHQYWLMQQQWHLASTALADVKASLAASPVSSAEALARQRLLGTPANSLPTAKELDELSLAQLEQSIQQLQQQPVSLFLVGETTAEAIEADVLPFLAANSRRASLVTYSPSLPDGRQRLAQPLHDEHKATVSIKGESELAWSPESSFLISSLNPIIQRALKNKLRHELGGIYSLSFEMSLDKDNKVRSSTRFTTAPEKLEMLLQAYQEVMAQLVSYLPEENFPRIREDIRFAEQLRLQSSNTWLRRLALSYQRYQNPQYLRSMQGLEQQLSSASLADFIQQIFPQVKQAVLIGLPKASSKQSSEEF